MRNTILFLFVFSIISIHSIVGQSVSKYEESMLEVNEFLLANEYNEALPILKKLVDEGYQNASVDYKLGLCYLNSNKDHEKAISYFLNALKGVSEKYNDAEGNEKNAPIRCFLYLGDAYRLELKIKEAEKAYKKYLTYVISIPEERALASKRLEDCHIALHLINNPVKVTFKNAGPTINSGISNFNVCLSGDGKNMVFTRRLKFYDAVYFCTKTETGWTNPENITTQIGSDGEFHPTGLSMDGSRMLLTSFTALSGYEIYESLKQNGKWSKVRILKSLNSPYHDLDAVYSPDSHAIYFSSNRKNGKGGYDLYFSVFDKDGNLSSPQNLESPINTIWDEKTPSFSNNGNLLSFSSDRSPSMGGFDLFYCEKKEGANWGNIFNMGYPLNTTGNDNNIQFASANRNGVVSRHVKEGLTDVDILEVFAPEFSKFRIIPVHGEIKINDKSDKLVKNSAFYLVDQEVKDTLTEVVTSDSGKFDVDLYPGKFELVMLNNSQRPNSQLFVIPNDLTDPFFNFSTNFTDSVALRNVATTASIVHVDSLEVLDLFFDFNKYLLTPEQKTKLRNLITSLQKYNVTKIELLGYSDPKGKAEYNFKLSLNRATQVAEFFRGNGIQENIIITKGLGSTNFISKNINSDGSDSPLGRSFNRRVEIVILTSDPHLIFYKKSLVPKDLHP